MTINGPAVLFSIITVVAVALALGLKSWIAKLIFMIVALGAATTATSLIGLGVGWGLLIDVAILIAIGVTAVRTKHTISRVVGAIMIILGVVVIYPSLLALGANTPGTVWSALVQSIQHGVSTFGDIVHRAIGGT